MEIDGVCLCVRIFPGLFSYRLLLKSIPSAIWLSAYFVYSYIAFAIHRFGDLFPFILIVSRMICGLHLFRCITV